MQKGRERGYFLQKWALEQSQAPIILCNKNEQTAKIPQEGEATNPLQDLSHQQR